MIYNNNNKISIFGENAAPNGDTETKGKIFDDVSWENNTQRISGDKQGIAYSEVINTALKQSSFMYYILAEALTKRYNDLIITTDYSKTSYSDVKAYINSVADKFKNGNLLLSEEITNNKIKDNILSSNKINESVFNDYHERLHVVDCIYVKKSIGKDVIISPENYTPNLISTKDVYNNILEKFTEVTENKSGQITVDGEEIGSIQLNLKIINKILTGTLTFSNFSQTAYTLNYDLKIPLNSEYYTNFTYIPINFYNIKDGVGSLYIRIAKDYTDNSIYFNIVFTNWTIGNLYPNIEFPLGYIDDN